MDIEFVPDFSYKGTYGIVCNCKSILKQMGNYSYISLNSRLYKYNTIAQELLAVYGTADYLITAFEVVCHPSSQEEWIVIGYSIGLVEVINLQKVIRLHRKKITTIRIQDNIVYTGSSDGTLCIYDLTIEMERHVNCNASIVDIKLNNYIFVACGNKTIRKYDKHAVLIDIFEINDFIHGFLIKEEELLVTCKNGDSFFIDLNKGNMTKFQTFKKPKTIKQIGNTVLIQTASKLFVFLSSKDNIFGLVLHETIVVPTKDLISVDKFGNDYVSISLKNSLEIFNSNQKIQFTSRYHETKIIQLEIVGNDIFSLSQDSFIVWNCVDNLHIELVVKIKLNGGRSFVVVDNNIFISVHNKINIYQKNIWNKINEVDVNATVMCYYGDIMTVCYEGLARFYTMDFSTLLLEISLPDSVVFARYSPEGLFSVSCIDGKVYIYNIIDFNCSTEIRQKFCLYGHSLPVRYFSFSPDNKVVITCGADKLIKVWGMDFGECRKTILGNSENIHYIPSTIFKLWFYNNQETNELIYNNKFKKLKTFKVFDGGIIQSSNQYLVCTENQGIALFTMDDHELLPCEKKVYETMIYKEDFITKIENYSKFISILEKLKTPTDDGFNQLYEFVTAIDFIEIKQFLHVLDSEAIYILIELIAKNIDKNIIINARLFKELYTYHKNILLAYPNIKNVINALIKKIGDLNELICYNDAELKIELNGIYLD